MTTHVPAVEQLVVEIFVRDAIGGVPTGSRLTASGAKVASAG
jgi:hypothetical protein